MKMKNKNGKINKYDNRLLYIKMSLYYFLN